MGVIGPQSQVNQTFGQAPAPDWSCRTSFIKNLSGTNRIKRLILIWFGICSYYKNRRRRLLLVVPDYRMGSRLLTLSKLPAETRLIPGVGLGQLMDRWLEMIEEKSAEVI